MNKKEINIIPIGDRVLIRPTTSLNENVNSFGFIIPAKEGETKFERGIVIATGPGRTNAEGKRIKMETKLGDIVMYKTGYDKEVISLGGEELILTFETNLLAIEVSKNKTKDEQK